MTLLDPPAAAARRQYAIDRLVEHLVAWGCPLDAAPHRAQVILGTVLEAGYALPTSLQGAPPAGEHSTPEGRARARAILEAELDRRRRDRETGDAPPQPADTAPAGGPPPVGTRDGSDRDTTRDVTP